MIIPHFLRHRTNPMFSRCLLTILLSTVGLLAGVVPEPSAQFPLLVFHRAAYAQPDLQEIGDREVTLYAQSVLDIEPLRQDAYDRIKRILGSVPPIDCSQPASLNSLAEPSRGIALNYCQQSKTILESNGLTIERFNDITVNKDRYPRLRERIRNEIIRIQQERARS